MRRPTAPLFLARAVYRKRRLRDAARLLPVLGVFLLLIPGLWAGDGPRSATAWAQDWVYLLVVWAGLIIVAAVLAPGLAASDIDTDTDTGTDKDEKAR